MIMGMGVVLYSVSAVTALFVEGNIWKIIAQRKLLKRINCMENHYIVCGAGQTGVHVIREMMEAEESVVVIESDTEVIEILKEEFKNIPVIQGDATSDSILDEVNLENAKGIVVALANDKDNLFLTLSARLKNQNIKIVAKAVELSLIDKLERAGANYVVSPNFIGGLRIASQMLRPHVVGFLDKMLRGQDKTVRIGEVTIGANSKYINKSISDANIFDSCQVYVMACSRKLRPDQFLYNPAPDTVLSEGDNLIFICTNEQQEKMNDLFA